MAKKKKQKVRHCCGKKFEKYKKYLRHRIKHHAEEMARSFDARHRNEYGQTGEEFKHTVRKQHKRCAICRQKFKSVVNPHQDHTHAIARLKVKVEVLKTGIKSAKRRYHAYNEEYDYHYTSGNRKKAVRMVKIKLRRRSRRGALCWPCNGGLRKWLDNPRKLRAAAKYLEKWEREQDWNNVKKERRHGNQ